MSLDSIQKLMVEEIRDLFDAEKQLTRALPRMAAASFSEVLKNAFESHLTETRQQILRLQQVFQDLGEKPRGRRCEAMEGLIREAQDMMEEEGEPAVKDAALIAAAQRIEHYEIAGYGCCRTWAQLLGLNRAMELLQLTLDEESATDERLSEIAQKHVHVRATTQA